MPKQLYQASASHCFAGDRVTAIADELVPENSNDHSIDRHTFWPHQGTSEWLQAQFEKPRTVQSVSVYWFDDSPQGGCRVPKSWRVLVQQGDQWKPVVLLSNRGYTVEKNQWNRIRFEAQETAAVRVEVELLPGYSGGVLELIIE